uniref:Uncharacterized protein n=1 Tax=Stomoxys calcitrans TaxID=35570 RepID=A0A1I8NRQ7_STOCA
MHNIKFTRDYLPKPSVNINTITRSKNQVLQLNKNEFLKCCIGLVAVKNLPLNIFNDERYFKRLINPYLEEYSLNLSSENMMDALEFWALRIRTYLKIKLHKKPLSLKLDVVGRHGKNILVIHVQQLEKYEIVVHTLGTIQLKTKPTSQTLKEAIWKCLKDYEIEGHQLYAVSSDSRGRSLKALQLIQDEMEENDMEIEENLQKPIFSIVFNGSYVIELAARIYFKTIDGDLKQCRQVIKAIHDRQMESMFLPSLDNSQRWKSTYDMVFSLKEFITNSEIEFEFEDKLEWLDSFLQTHEPLHVWSQQQHSEQYIVGDFYRDWLVCEAKLKQWPHNEYAMHLLEAMLELKQTMLDNEAFNAALYFDPRFNHLDTPYFSEERKKQAVVRLNKGLKFLRENKKF